MGVVDILVRRILTAAKGGKDDDPNDDVFAGGKSVFQIDYMSQIVTALFLAAFIFFTILFEKFLHWTEHRIRNWENATTYLVMLGKLYKELMILGMLSFGLNMMLILGYEYIRHDLLLIFEFVHLWIFAVALFFILHTMIFISRGQQYSASWYRAAHRSVLSIRQSYKRTFRAQETNRFRAWFYRTWYRCRLFVGNIPFVRDMQYHHFRVWFVKQNRLPRNFDFTAYLTQCIISFFTDHIDSRPLIWALLIIFLLIFALAAMIAHAVRHEPLDDSEFQPIHPYTEWKALLISAWVIFAWGWLMMFESRRLKDNLLRESGVHRPRLLWTSLLKEIKELHKIPYYLPNQGELLEDKLTHLPQFDFAVRRSLSPQHIFNHAKERDSVEIMRRGWETGSSTPTKKRKSKRMNNGTVEGKERPPKEIPDGAVQVEISSIGLTNGLPPPPPPPPPSPPAPTDESTMMKALHSQASKKQHESHESIFSRMATINHGTGGSVEETNDERIRHIFGWSWPKLYTGAFDMLMMCQCFYLGYFLLRGVHWGLTLFDGTARKGDEAYYFVGCLLPQLLVMFWCAPVAIRDFVLTMSVAQFNAQVAANVKSKMDEQFIMANKLGTELRRSLARDMKLPENDFSTPEQVQEAEERIRQIFKELSVMFGKKKRAQSPGVQEKPLPQPSGVDPQDIGLLTPGERYSQLKTQSSASKLQLPKLSCAVTKAQQRVNRKQNKAKTRRASQGLQGFLLTPALFQEALWVFNLSVSKKQAMQILRAIDIDLDGHVDLQEFLDFVFNQIGNKRTVDRATYKNVSQLHSLERRRKRSKSSKDKNSSRSQRSGSPLASEWARRSIRNNPLDKVDSKNEDLVVVEHKCAPDATAAAFPVLDVSSTTKLEQMPAEPARLVEPACTNLESSRTNSESTLIVEPAAGNSASTPAVHPVGQDVDVYLAVTNVLPVPSPDGSPSKSLTNVHGFHRPSPSKSFSFVQRVPSPRPATRASSLPKPASWLPKLLSNVLTPTRSRPLSPREDITITSPKWHFPEPDMQDEQPFLRASWWESKEDKRTQMQSSPQGAGQQLFAPTACHISKERDLLHVQMTRIHRLTESGEHVGAGNAEDEEPGAVADEEDEEEEDEERVEEGQAPTTW